MQPSSYMVAAAEAAEAAAAPASTMRSSQAVPSRAGHHQRLQSRGPRNVDADQVGRATPAVAAAAPASKRRQPKQQQSPQPVKKQRAAGSVGGTAAASSGRHQQGRISQQKLAGTAPASTSDGGEGSLPGCSPRTPSPASVLRSEHISVEAAGEADLEQEEEAESVRAGMQRWHAQQQVLQQQLDRLQQQLQQKEQRQGQAESELVDDDLLAQAQQVMQQLHDLQEQIQQNQDVKAGSTFDCDRGPGAATVKAETEAADEVESPMFGLACLAAFAAAAADGELSDSMEDAVVADLQQQHQQQQTGRLASKSLSRKPGSGVSGGVKPQHSQGHQQQQQPAGEGDDLALPSATSYEEDAERDAQWQQQLQQEQQRRQQVLLRRLQQRLQQHSAARAAAVIAVAAAAAAAAAAADPAGRRQLLQQTGPRAAAAEPAMQAVQAPHYEEVVQGFWRQQQLLAQRQRKRQHALRARHQQQQQRHGLRKRVAAAAIRRAAQRNWQQRMVRQRQLQEEQGCQQPLQQTADGLALACLQQQLRDELRDLQESLLQQQEEGQEEGEAASEPGEDWLTAEEEEEVQKLQDLAPLGACPSLAIAILDTTFATSSSTSGGSSLLKQAKLDAWDVFEQTSDGLAVLALQANRRRLRRSRRLMTAGIRKVLPLWGGHRGAGIHRLSSGSGMLGSRQNLRSRRVSKPQWAGVYGHLPAKAARLLAGSLAGTAALEAAGLAAPGAAAATAAAAAELEQVKWWQQQAEERVAEQQRLEQQTAKQFDGAAAADILQTAAAGHAGSAAAAAAAGAAGHSAPQPGSSITSPALAQGVQREGSEQLSTSSRAKGKYLVRDSSGKFCRIGDGATSNRRRNRPPKSSRGRRRTYF